MSEVAITFMRFGFLIALWLVVAAIVLVLRRDLAAPREAKPQPPRGAGPARAHNSAGAAAAEAARTQPVFRHAS